MRRRRKPERGVTLLELLLAVTLTTVVAGAIIAFFINSRENLQIANDTVQAQSETRTVLARLELELRSASLVSFNSGGTPPFSTIAFTTLLQDGTAPSSIRYFTTTTSGKTTLSRELNGTAAIVVRDITQFELIRATGQTAEMQLTARENGRLAVSRIQVAFRNP